jgi:hypothetical protein
MTASGASYLALIRHGMFWRRLRRAQLHDDVWQRPLADK